MAMTSPIFVVLAYICEIYVCYIIFNDPKKRYLMFNYEILYSKSSTLRLQYLSLLFLNTITEQTKSFVTWEVVECETSSAIY